MAPRQLLFIMVNKRLTRWPGCEIYGSRGIPGADVSATSGQMVSYKTKFRRAQPDGPDVPRRHCEGLLGDLRLVLAVSRHLLGGVLGRLGTPRGDFAPKPRRAA